MFFFQENIADYKGWPHAALASGFALMAMCGIFATICTGFLVDKYSAKRVMPFYLLPLALGCFLLGIGESSVFAYFFMMCFGVSNGMMVLFGPIFAECFGTKIIGQLKSIFMAVMVFATALTPPIFGYLFDNHIDFSFLSLSLAIGCLVAFAVLIIIALMQHRVSLKSL